MSPLWKNIKKNLSQFAGSGSESSDSEDKDLDDVIPSDAAMESDTGRPRMVECVKLRRELPGLSRPPFPGDLGARIFENVSQQAFDMWRQQQTLIINHYGLNLADPEAKQFLLQEMEAFFFADQQHVPEGWVPEGQAGKVAPQGKGGVAPQGKGGVAPPRKA